MIEQLKLLRDFVHRNREALSTSLFVTYPTPSCGRAAFVTEFERLIEITKPELDDLTADADAEGTKTGGPA